MASGMAISSLIVTTRPFVAALRLLWSPPPSRALGQPVGQYATGRARPDDDVIRLHAPRSPVTPSTRPPISRSLAHRGRSEALQRVTERRFTPPVPKVARPLARPGPARPSPQAKERGAP